MRAALLPCVGDLFVMRYWLRHFERVWRDEVDELHVYASNCAEPGPVRAAVEAVGGKFWTKSEGEIHGRAMVEMLERGTPEYVMFCEDDAFVRRPGVVSGAFERVESGACDVVGSPRCFVSAEIAAAAVERWGDPPTASDTGFGWSLWPCFLFARAETLLSTERRFHSWNPDPGSFVPGIEYTTPDWPLQTTDTFATASFELRQQGRSVMIEPQNILVPSYGPPRGIPEATERMPWFHVGSLGGCEKAALRGNYDYALNSVDVQDWAFRLWWWRHMAESEPGNEDMLRNLERFRERVGLAPEDISVLDSVLTPWITWDDQA